MGDGVDQGIKVEGWQIWVLCLDEHHIGSVVPEERVSPMSHLSGFLNVHLLTNAIHLKSKCPMYIERLTVGTARQFESECFCLPREVDMMWEVVVQVGEGDFVLRPYWLSDDDLVDVIELIPVFIPVKR